MKGIIIANKAREESFFPLTIQLSKYFMPVYDKPLIYYPMSVLMNAGIREILIVTVHEDIALYMQLFGNGDSLGISISYTTHNSTNIGDVIYANHEFIGNDCVAIVEGDTIITGSTLKRKSYDAFNRAKSGTTTLFSSYVENTNHPNVFMFDAVERHFFIEDHPLQFADNYCLTGLSFYDFTMVYSIAKLHSGISNNSLLIDLYNECLKSNELVVEYFDYDYSWISITNPETLYDATMYIRQLEKFQHRKIACLEEISLLNGWITFQEVDDLSLIYRTNQYGDYLKEVINGNYLTE